MKARWRKSLASSGAAILTALLSLAPLAPPAIAQAEAPGRVWPEKSGYTLLDPAPEEYMRELSADRPDKTDSPFTVDAGHFQLEMDVVNLTYNPSTPGRGNARLISLEAAPMNVKVGLLNDLDFQLVYTPYRLERVDPNAGRAEWQSGFSGITPRFKWNVLGNDGGFFALALLPFVSLPVGQGQLGSGSVEGGVGIPYAFDVPGWDFGLQTSFRLIRNQTDNGYHTEFDNSVSSGHRLIGKLSCYAEFFSRVSTERSAGWIGTADTWLTYELNKNLRLDSGVYFGVTSAADKWRPWIGMTWRY